MLFGQKDSPSLPGSRLLFDEECYDISKALTDFTMWVWVWVALIQQVVHRSVNCTSSSGETSLLVSLTGNDIPCMEGSELMDNDAKLLTPEVEPVETHSHAAHNTAHVKAVKHVRTRAGRGATL